MTETRESVFTQELFGILGLYLMDARENGRVNGAGPRLERVDDNRILWKFGRNAMSITVNEVEP